MHAGKLALRAPEVALPIGERALWPLGEVALPIPEVALLIAEKSLLPLGEVGLPIPKSVSPNDKGESPITERVAGLEETLDRPSGELTLPRR